MANTKSKKEMWTDFIANCDDLAILKDAFLSYLECVEAEIELYKDLEKSRTDFIQHLTLSHQLFVKSVGNILSVPNS